MDIDFALQSLLHVAIVPDGNGRWASARGLLRSEGHRAGMDAVRRVVRASPELGIGTLTIQALGSDHWIRPAAEVQSILAYVAAFLDSESRNFLSEGVRVSVFGRRDRLPPSVVRSIESAESATAGGAKLHLRLAVDYSARAALRQAASGPAAPDAPQEERAVREPFGPPVDLLLRSGGKQRLGDFLLWECAYAELEFLPLLWPDFGPAELEAVLDLFRRRDPRFAGLPAFRGAAAHDSSAARAPSSSRR
jgi:undecaprenyl diphosphate synthase